MYEMERVMLLDKCIVTIVYAAACKDFLQIDSQSLA
jgi:hypothetical protein